MGEFVMFAFLYGDGVVGEFADGQAGESEDGENPEDEDDEPRLPFRRLEIECEQGASVQHQQGEQSAYGRNHPPGKIVGNQVKHKCFGIVRCGQDFPLKQQRDGVMHEHNQSAAEQA